MLPAASPLRSSTKPLVLCLALLLYCSTVSGGGSSNVTDELTLLSFKSTLYSDPTGSLDSWNTSNRLCSWRGVKCGRRHPERVVALCMNSFGLAGRLPPSLANLSFLRRLDVGNNSLRGQIPQELGLLERLRVLDLSVNSLEGSIPAALGNCSQLREMNLTENQLRGEIPSETGSMRNLALLDLRHNGLSGEIPASFKNLSSIVVLRLTNNTLSGKIPIALGGLSTLYMLGLSFNFLSGGIPSSLGHLSKLSVLSVGFNHLSGTIPPAIWNISSLTQIHVSGNNLSGRIPPGPFSTLPSLEVLCMYQNRFHGPLPSTLINASNLRDIEFHTNMFSGKIPPVFGHFKNLQKLFLSDNFFEAEEPEEWEFMTALTNCTNLQILYVSNNNFSGELPTSVSNPSISLEFLAISMTEISGSIPIGIGNLANLQYLSLYSCKFIGSLPSSLGMLRSLLVLDVANNNLSGKIPWTIKNITRMYYLNLAYNSFADKIPVGLGNMRSLTYLYLSHNQLMGTIPGDLVSISTLSIAFDVSHNLLGGPIPSEVGNLQNLEVFHAESNGLYGEIPSSFGECQVLQNLYLQDNFLQGTIPSALSGLKGLEILDLSNNKLSGQIPIFLEDFRSLSRLNLSFNNFVGQVPTTGVFANASAISIQGNRELCGGIEYLHLPPCSLQSPKKKHKFSVVITVISLAATLCTCLLVVFFVALCKRKSTKGPSAISSLRGAPTISYSELVKATDGFATTNLIGAGSFGSVYKGRLDGEGDDNANLVAVKVLNLQTRGALRSFTAECEAMRNLRHRNLVKIITVCSSIDSKGNDFKAIVLDFMPNGSLEDWLHPESQRHLSLLQRANIAFDVASALHYLHHHAAAPVVHCDIKPSNVLLDEDMVAHVGDFGIARILAEESSSFPEKSSSSTGFQGTIGYAPTEYGAGNRVSTHGDIYSFGVVLLEMVTGKRPTNSMFSEGTSLPKYVEMALLEKVIDIVDMNLVDELQDIEEALVEARDADCSSTNGRKVACVTSLLRLGLLCCEEMPINRIQIENIVNELCAIKQVLIGRGI